MKGNRFDLFILINNNDSEKEDYRGENRQKYIGEKWLKTSHAA